MIVTLGSSALAADSRNITQIGRAFHGYGATNRLAVIGDQVALASGVGGLQMVDCSDPEDPRAAGYFDDNKYPMVDVAIRGEFIYGLYSAEDQPSKCGVFTALLDEENPRAIGRADRNDARATQLILTDLCGIVLGTDVALIDLSDAFEPAFIGRIPTSATDAAWIDSHLYLVQAGGIAIYHLEDPANAPMERSAFFDHAGIRKIAVQDTLLYLIDQEGFKVYSIAQPYSPTLLGAFNENNLSQLLLTDEFLIITGSDGLVVMSVENPNEPSVIYHDEHGFSFRDLVMNGSTLYALIDYSTLVAYNMADPANPVRTIYYHFGNQTLAIKMIESCGNYVYVCDGGYLSVWDMTNPFDFCETGGYVAPANIIDLEATNDYLFTAVGARGIRILSLENPHQPQVVGFVDSIGMTTSICLIDNFLYVATNDSGMQIVDVSDPINPVKIGRYPSSGRSSIAQIIASEDRLFLRKNSAVEVLHANQNGQVDTLRTMTFQHTIAHICVSNHLLFMIESFQRNWVYNISNLDTPRVVRNFNPPGASRSMLARENHLFIADGAWGGLRTYEITDADTLIETGYYDTPGDANQIALTGNIAYVAGSTNFALYDCSQALPVKPEPPALVSELQLLQAFPAPFNQFLSIDYAIPSMGVVTISAFDPLGRRIDEVLLPRQLFPGSYHTIWQPSNIASGPIYIRLDLNDRPISTLQVLQVK